jgi:hypothetical protein
MNPLRNQSSSVRPFFHSLGEDLFFFLESIMKVEFPIGEVINHEFLSSDILLSIGLKSSKVVVYVEGKDDSFPSDDREKDVPKGFVASGTGSAEVFGSKIRLLQKVLVFGILLFE